MEVLHRSQVGRLVLSAVHHEHVMAMCEIFDDRPSE